MSETHLPSCSGARRSVAASLLMGAGLALLTVAGYRLGVAPLTRARDLHASGTAWSALPLDLVLPCLAATALLGCAVWLVGATLATVVEVLTGASWALARAATPGVVRRTVQVACGVAVGSAGILTPAAAAPGPGTEQPLAVASPAPGPAPSPLEGLSVPDRQVGPSGPRAPRSPTPGSLREAGLRPVSTAPAAQRPGRLLRVRSGDSLWSIAERLLPDAGAAEVDDAWRRIYRANRSAVGHDPDLIVPGTVLHLPERRSWSTRPDDETGQPPPRKDAS